MGKNYVNNPPSFPEATPTLGKQAVVLQAFQEPAQQDPSKDFPCDGQQKDTPVIFTGFRFPFGS